MLLASLLFAFMGAFAKLSSMHMSPLEVVFFRNVFGVALILGSFWHRPMRQKGGKLWLLLFRGTMGFLALLAFFYNIAHIPLGDAITFSKTSPFFTALFAMLLLGERLSMRGWVALGIGFAGIVLVAKPQGLAFAYTDYIGIFSGLGAALAYLSVRELRHYYEIRTIVLSFVTIGTVGPLLLMLVSPYLTHESLAFARGEFVLPHGIVWLYVAGMGVAATAAQLLMTKAYATTQAGIVGAASYANIPFAIGVGFILGDAFPDMITLSGIALIIAAGSMVAFVTKEKQ